MIFPRVVPNKYISEFFQPGKEIDVYDLYPQNFDFEDIFPVSLSDLTMDSRDTNIDYIEATANFRFLRYTFTPL